MTAPTQIERDTTDDARRRFYDDAVGAWLTVEQIAARCGVSTDTVYPWVRSGELAAIKWGKRWRVHPDDFADFVDRARRGDRGAA